MTNKGSGVIARALARSNLIHFVTLMLHLLLLITPINSTGLLKFIDMAYKCNITVTLWTNF